MTDELRKKFGGADGSLLTALNSYDVGKHAKAWELVRSGQDEVNRLQGIIDDVEQAIQKRLRYEEA